MFHTPPQRFARGAAASAALCCALATAPAAAAPQDPRQDPALRVELQYIEALNAAGMPDFADLVLKDVQARWPEAKALLKTKALEQVLSLGRFDEAEKIIRAEKDQDAPETWAMKLLSADYRFSRGQYPEALGAYQAFFKKYAGKPPAALVSAYAQNYYKFVQMLLFLHREAEAAAAYEAMLKLPDLENETRRQAQFEWAQLLVKMAEDVKPDKNGKPTKERTDKLDKADKAVQALLWEQDLWFGRGVALLAHIRALRGKPEEARDIVNTYMEQLVSIDRQLQEQGEEQGVDLMGLSPIAESRYLVGTILADEADSMFDKSKGGLSAADEEKAVGIYDEALTELVNVYVQYPGFAWAVDAMDRVEAIERRLDTLGYEVESNITPEQRAKVATKQFANAASLYHQNQFEKAIQSFESVLKNYPQVVPDSIQGLGLLIQSYVELAEGLDNAEDAQFRKLEAEVVASGMAERFAMSGRDGVVKAGDTLRALSAFFADHGMPDAARRAMDDFFRLYPTHPVAADALLAEAAKAYRGDPPDYAEAARLYTVLAENYTSSQRSVDAMRYLGDCYAKLGDSAAEITARSNYVARLEKDDKPSSALLHARYSLTRAHKNAALERLRAATSAWDDIRRGVAPAPATPAPAEDGAPADQDSKEAAPEQGKSPADAALEELVAANRAVAECTESYVELIKTLAGKDRAMFESNAKEKQANNNLLLASLFDAASCYSSLNQPTAQLPLFKKRAIQMYETVVKLFPKNDNMPQVYLQLGTLYSTLPGEGAEAEANAKKATEWFDALSKDYPDSEQARNALYRQGKALLDLGYRTQGLAKFKEMISSPSGKYTAQQLANAADEIFAAKDYALAEQGYAAALSRAEPEETSLRARIAFGRARILVAQEKLPEARAALEAFVKDNPRSASVIEANELICEVCLKAAAAEKDRAARTDLFKGAIAAVQALRPYKTAPRDAVDLQLRIGSIMEAQAAAETEMGDKATADDLLRKAAGHYQTLVLSADLSDMSLRQGQEKIFARAVRTLAATKVYNDGTPVWEDVKDLCERYLEYFPQGPSATEVRKTLGEANSNLAVGG